MNVLVVYAVPLHDCYVSLLQLRFGVVANEATNEVVVPSVK